MHDREMNTARDSESSLPNVHEKREVLSATFMKNVKTELVKNTTDFVKCFTVLVKNIQIS